MEPELHINDLWRVWQWDEKVRIIFIAGCPIFILLRSLVLSAVCFGHVWGFYPSLFAFLLSYGSKGISDKIRF